MLNCETGLEIQLELVLTDRLPRIAIVRVSTIVERFKCDKLHRVPINRTFRLVEKRIDLRDIPVAGKFNTA